MSNNQPTGAPQAHAIGFTNIANFVFNIGTLLAIDLTQYEHAKPGRVAALILIGPYEQEFVDADADQVYMWYLEISGQARIEKPTAMYPVAPLIP